MAGPFPTHVTGPFVGQIDGFRAELRHLGIPGGLEHGGGDHGPQARCEAVPDIGEPPGSGQVEDCQCHGLRSGGGHECSLSAFLVCFCSSGGWSV